MIITIKYPCKYRLNFAQNYVFSGDKCFNSKTNREIKQVYNNGSIGYNVNGKFHSLKSLKPKLAKEFNVTYRTIANIKSRKTWKHLD